MLIEIKNISCHSSVCLEDWFPSNKFPPTLSSSTFVSYFAQQSESICEFKFNHAAASAPNRL